jgi:hypothetical protein
MREVIACLNAGDSARLAALFTDRYIVSQLEVAGITLQELDLLFAPPAPLPPPQRFGLRTLRGAYSLAGGGVGAVVELSRLTGVTVVIYTYHVRFTFERGPYRIDEITEFSGMRRTEDATPTVPDRASSPVPL